VRRAVAVLIFVFSSAAHAFSCCSNFGQGRIGAGIDVIHEKGMPVANVSLYPASLYVWERNYGVVLAYPIGQPTGLNAEFGGILVRYLHEDVNGTHGNFFTRLSWCWTRACVSFAHISHGARLFGIKDELDNKGLNFLFLEYKYR
jgi:hypothetical protein